MLAEPTMKPREKALLYWPAIFPLNLKILVIIPEVSQLGNFSPCNNTWESGIRTSGTQESAKVPCSSGGAKEIDAEANGTDGKTCEDERPTQLLFVRIMCEDQQEYRWEKVSIQ